MKFAPNDPCPCGSAKKYKKCCGRVVASAVSAVKRECGACTACCDGWMAGTIRGHEMKPGMRCHFVAEGRGCTIYGDRPQSPCRNFTCAWIAPDSPFPDEFRPDRLRVIMAPIQWRGRPAYLLVSAGRDPDTQLLEWMQAFAVRTQRPFFYAQNGEKLGFGPTEFQRDMLERQQRGEKMW